VCSLEAAFRQRVWWCGRKRRGRAPERRCDENRQRKPTPRRPRAPSRRGRIGRRPPAPHRWADRLRQSFRGSLFEARLTMTSSSSEGRREFSPPAPANRDSRCRQRGPTRVAASVERPAVTAGSSGRSFTRMQRPGTGPPSSAQNSCCTADKRRPPPTRSRPKRDLPPGKPGAEEHAFSGQIGHLATEIPLFGDTTWRRWTRLD